MPDEVKNAEPRNPQDITDALDAFGLRIAQLRREAIDGRQQLGIEDEWYEDEEAYIGVDDANRAEFRTTWRQTKPTTTGMWSTETKKKRSSTKSNALINITRPYVDAASARMADMLLPTDDKCWAIEPTPIPDLDKAANDEAAVKIAVSVDPDTGEQIIEEFSAKDFRRAVMEVATERAESASTRIEDWLEECQFQHNCRRVIHSSAKLGTGVLKGPFPKSKRKTKWDLTDEGAIKKVINEISPNSRWIDPWNVFPDPACGENHQDGSYFFERDYITNKRLIALKKEPGYIANQIDACIKEGPIQPEMHWTPAIEIERMQITETMPFEIWYFSGAVEVEELQLAGLAVGDLSPEQLEQDSGFVNVIVTMVNHRVVRASISPLDDGEFEYDFFVWQERPGMPWGIGVSRQVRIAQRMLTAAVRNMMDNAALSGGPQIVVNTKVIEPVDGTWEIYPRKVWKAVDGAEDLEVEKAFKIFTIETRQPELLAIINFALRMAEESTGLPMILQGQMSQMPEKKVETLGGMQMLNNNASSVLRRLAKGFDDKITVPHITRYYMWLMEYGKEMSEKGDFAIVARGSSTLVERDLQNQEIVTLIDICKDDVFGLDPKKTADEFLRSRKFDPKRFRPTEEEQEVIDAQPPPTDPRIETAIIKAEADAIEGQAEREHEAIENEKDREADMEKTILEVNAEAERYNAEAELKAAVGSGV